MLYTNWTVGEKEYHLRLTTRATVELEKKLGRNPVEVFLDAAGGHLPTLSAMASTLHASLQPLHHGITEGEAFEILDQWFEEGHVMTDLIPVLLEVFQVSGLVGREPGGTEKNGQAGTA